MSNHHQHKQPCPRCRSITSCECRRGVSTVDNGPYVSEADWILDETERVFHPPVVYGAPVEFEDQRFPLSGIDRGEGDSFTVAQMAEIRQDQRVFLRGPAILAGHPNKNGDVFSPGALRRALDKHNERVNSPNHQLGPKDAHLLPDDTLEKAAEWINDHSHAFDAELVGGGMVMTPRGPYVKHVNEPIRGVTADCVIFDEIQEFNADPVKDPVIGLIGEFARTILSLPEEQRAAELADLKRKHPLTGERVEARMQELGEPKPEPSYMFDFEWGVPQEPKPLTVEDIERVREILHRNARKIPNLMPMPFPIADYDIDVKQVGDGSDRKLDCTITLKRAGSDLTEETVQQIIDDLEKFRREAVAVAPPVFGEPAIQKAYKSHKLKKVMEAAEKASIRLPVQENEMGQDGKFRQIRRPTRTKSSQEAVDQAKKDYDEYNSNEARRALARSELIEQANLERAQNRRDQFVSDMMESRDKIAAMREAGTWDAATSLGQTMPEKFRRALNIKDILQRFDMFTIQFFGGDLVEVSEHHLKWSEHPLMKRLCRLLVDRDSHGILEVDLRGYILKEVIEGEKPMFMRLFNMKTYGHGVGPREELPVGPRVPPPDYDVKVGKEFFEVKATRKHFGMAVGNVDGIKKLTIGPKYTPEQADNMGFLHSFWGVAPELSQNGPDHRFEIRSTAPWYNVERNMADLDFRKEHGIEGWLCHVQWSAGDNFDVVEGDTLKECCEAVVDLLDEAAYEDIPDHGPFEEEPKKEVVTEHIGTGHMGSTGFGRPR
jgi:hypothetical protein